MNYYAFKTLTKSYFLPFFDKLLGVSLTTLIKHTVGNPFINVHRREKDNAATNITFFLEKEQPTELELRKKTMTVTPHNIYHGP